MDSSPPELDHKDDDDTPVPASAAAPPCTPADLDAALRVLEAYQSDELAHLDRSDPSVVKQLRRLRMAVKSIGEGFEKRRFEGGTEEQYRSQYGRQVEAKRQLQRDRAQDKAYVNKTAMRASRLARLAVLGEQSELAASLPLVADGVADDAALPPAATAPRAIKDAPVARGAVAELPGPPSSGATAPPDERDDDTADGGEGSFGVNEGEGDARRLLHPRACYTCKARFRDLHHFYGTFCPSCAAHNWEKRNQTCDLAGRVALVTGARVKIGFHCALKLLRAGAEVIATSRFPVDTAKRYAALPDFAAWGDRLHVYGIDLRDLRTLEAFCDHLARKFDRLDVLLNNACQTVRRPPAYYAPLLGMEGTRVGALPAPVQSVLRQHHGFLAALHEGGAGRALAASAEEEGVPRALVDFDGGAPTAAAVAGSAAASPTTEPAAQAAGASASLAPSAAMSQLSLLPGDGIVDSDVFPTGLVDVNAQQIDLRTRNSWLLHLEEVSSPELAEVMVINAMAPFILNSRLKALMMRGRPGWQPSSDSANKGIGVAALRGTPLQAGVDPAASAAAADFSRRAHGASALLGELAPPVLADHARFIVNVSAMEGKFYRKKLPSHPHTNMAKAALNMMTRTSAGAFALEGIFMNACDTGWVNPEGPTEKEAATAAKHNFQTPLDEIDAAARILDPVFCPVASAAGPGAAGLCRPIFGAFLKDFRASEW